MSFIQPIFSILTTGASLFCYASAGADFGEAKFGRPLIKVLCGAGAHLVSSGLTSAATTAYLGKAMAISALGAYTIAGFDQFRLAISEPSPSRWKIMKGAVQWLGATACSAITANADAGIVSKLQNALTIGGLSAAFALDGTIGFVQKNQRLGLLKCGMGVIGVLYAGHSLLASSTNPI